MPDSSLLQVRELSKTFPGVVALDKVSLSLTAGEVLAVVGENGAGKSTLMKILAGVQTPDAGEILLDGKPVVIDSPRTALKLGVSLIHQELNLADNLDIAANIYLGREPRIGRGMFSLIRKSVIHRQARTYLQKVGLDLPTSTLVGSLSVARQQMVEIAKALSGDARIMIMDEPTSSLTAGEAENLFRIVAELKKAGIGVIYISHRLSEVQRLADRVVVLRDGRNAGELAREDISHDRIVRLMVGRDLSQHFRRTPHAKGDVLLRVKDLRTPAHPAYPLNFEIRKGEVVGIAGLVGAGRTELLTTLFGVTPAAGGTIEMDGREIAIARPRDAIRAGMALVPEDRKQQGLVGEMSVQQNISLATLRRQSRLGLFPSRSREQSLAAEMSKALNVKTPSLSQLVRLLSGGNQQKVVIGRWLAFSPKLLLMDEPTRGIDIGAKREIYDIMSRLAGEGIATLFVSSEMEEVIAMSDRVIVMHEGRITGELTREKLTEEAIMHLATGRTDSPHIHEAAR